MSEQTSKKSNKKILFICTGNTCRSPMAERLLKAKIKEKKWKGFSISSAGIAAKKGDVINPKSAYVLAENGIDASKFSSKLLKGSVLVDAFAVICMTEAQRDTLLDMRWQALRKADRIGEEEIPNNIYSFAELGGYEIPDPYGRELDCYRYVFSLLAAGMAGVIDKLRLEEFAEKPKPRATKRAEKQLNAYLPPSNGTSEGENASKKRGRPKKQTEGEGALPATPKKRGRPKKEKSSETDEQLKIL